MGFKEFALRMYPFWILGILVIGAVIASGNKNLLRIEKSSVIKWVKFLMVITVLRTVLYKLMLHPYLDSAIKSAHFLPCTVAFTVFWEDAVHGLPLLILRKLIGVNKWTIPIHFILTLLFMVEFGLGHVYQGPLMALILSFYIPYSVKLGDRRGFGTVMICHVLYDFFTLFFVKFLTHL